MGSNFHRIPFWLNAAGLAFLRSKQTSKPAMSFTTSSGTTVATSHLATSINLSSRAKSLDKALATEKRSLLLPAHPRFCDRCLAMQGTRCRPELDYRNVTNSSAWHLTAINHQAYMQFDADSLSHWVSMPGFNFLAITFDWMHNVYLGTGRDLCASGIIVLIDKGLVGGLDGLDMDEALTRVHRRMRDVCRQHGFLGTKVPFCQLV